MNSVDVLTRAGFFFGAGRNGTGKEVVGAGAGYS